MVNQERGRTNHPDSGTTPLKEKESGIGVPPASAAARRARISARKLLPNTGRMAQVP